MVDLTSAGVNGGVACFPSQESAGTRNWRRAQLLPAVRRAVVGVDGGVHYARVQRGREMGDRLEVLGGVAEASNWRSIRATWCGKASRLAPKEKG
jgi:hypothetical protein